MTPIQFNTAKLAKKRGFDLITENRYFFNSELTTKTPTQSSKPTLYAPTQSELQGWLRDVHKIYLYIVPVGDVSYNLKYWNYSIFGKDYKEGQHGTNRFTSYEDALEAGLFEALKLIENDNN